MFAIIYRGPTMLKLRRVKVEPFDSLLSLKAGSLELNLMFGFGI